MATVIAKAPPKSLAMLQGEYGFSPIKFWIVFRPITILLFLIAIGLNWKISISRRKLLLFCFSVDMLTTIATFIYFAPETGKIVSAAYSDSIDQNLLAMTQRWMVLNYFRLAAFYVTAFFLLVALSRPATASSKDHY